MKKTLLSLIISLSSVICYSQIGYTFSSPAGSYAANTAPTTVLHSNGVDDAISASTAIGFNFNFGCISYTTFQASSNGVMFLGTTGAGSNNFNDLATCANRPIIAPLWDDLATGSGGNVNYKLTGTAPNRVLTIEWKQMEWGYAATTWGVEFQVKLYETTNRIEFVYNRNGTVAQYLSGAGASMGLGGVNSGDFYSLNGTGTTPAASKVTETTSLSNKPATGQLYRWDPIICSGAPAPGTSAASPTTGCAGFTSSLSLSGVTAACGLTYQWYRSTTAAAGPYTSIGGATSVTQTVSTTVPSWYRCVVSCGASSATSTAVQTTTGNIGTAATLPYASGAVTTCGSGDNISDNITNVCGISDYFTGEDRTYRFTPATTGQVTITHGSSSYYDTGLSLYTGCPTAASAVCVESSQYYDNGTRTMCTNVTAGTTYYLIVDGWGGCNAYSVTISNPNTAVASSTCDMGYTAASTTFSLENVTGTVLPTTDDILFNSIINFGFPVCFDGAKYYGGYVASNSAFVFDAIPCYPNIDVDIVAAGGAATSYDIPYPAPVNNTSIPRNAILAPWHDIDPSIAGGVMSYTTLGTAPNRRCIITFSNIAMFGCNSLKHTSQIKIFETTNNIEIHVANKPVCFSWDDGGAVMGLLNYNGTKYVPPVNQTAHNINVAHTHTWTMTNTAYRFTTTCGQAGGACLTLPIGFKSFYGERADHINHLYWQTATESDLKDFIVQRSTDGINFTTIGQVHPHNTPSSYTFNDVNAPVGITSYYRIQIDEYSGIISYTDVYPLGSGVNEVLNVSQLYPNPAKTDFTISFDSRKTGYATISIYDVYGKLIKAVPHEVYAGVTRTTVTTDEMPFGVYYVEVINSFNETITKQKLIIQK